MKSYLCEVPAREADVTSDDNARFGPLANVSASIWDGHEAGFSIDRGSMMILRRPSNLGVASAGRGSPTKGQAS